MNAPTSFPEAASADTPERAQRHDGFTPDRRRLFLAAISEGHTVDAACGHVGLSRSAAYALRRGDEDFARGWSAACLVARDALADILWSRAIDGQVDTYTRADGAQEAHAMRGFRSLHEAIRRLVELGLKAKGK